MRAAVALRKLVRGDRALGVRVLNLDPREHCRSPRVTRLPTEHDLDCDAPVACLARRTCVRGRAPSLRVVADGRQLSALGRNGAGVPRDKPTYINSEVHRKQYYWIYCSRDSRW